MLVFPQKDQTVAWLKLLVRNFADLFYSRKLQGATEKTEHQALALHNYQQLQSGQTSVTYECKYIQLNISPTCVTEVKQ